MKDLLRQNTLEPSKGTEPTQMHYLQDYVVQALCSVSIWNHHWWGVNKRQSFEANHLSIDIVSSSLLG